MLVSAEYLSRNLFVRNFEQLWCCLHVVEHLLYNCVIFVLLFYNSNTLYNLLIDVLIA